ncbi:serine hydrolase domain-containing protein [Vibrio sonorensis]|uniref:serine hydrolase domain-containing protein n=1 Tax=Vibrio sonorensis TaxID=1004316 RepID=UPI0008D95241|nr:serine hydrolase domain-containing protein [Vibrio sonorensis]
MENLSATNRTKKLALVVSLIATSPFTLANDSNLSTEIERLSETFLNSDPSPGVAVTVVKDFNVIVNKGFGLAEVEHNVKTTNKTIFRVGSLTKQFTAAGILKLAEEGKIDLDSPIKTYLKDYPSTSSLVTVKHLLNHTSGIPSYTDLGDTFWKHLRKDHSHQEMLDYFKDKELDFTPGQEFAYNNSGYYLLGMIIESVSGKSYAQYIQEEFSEPLGLVNTALCNDSKIVNNRASGYTLKDEKLHNADLASMTQPFSAGALCSTAEDIINWTMDLTHGEVVSKSSYNLMTQNTVLNDQSIETYGYGLNLTPYNDEDMISHSGGMIGFNAFALYLPKHDSYISVLTNSDHGDSRKLALQIVDLIVKD